MEAKNKSSFSQRLQEKSRRRRVSRRRRETGVFLISDMWKYKKVEEDCGGQFGGIKDKNAIKLYETKINSVCFFFFMFAHKEKVPSKENVHLTNCKCIPNFEIENAKQKIHLASFSLPYSTKKEKKSYTHMRGCHK